MYGHELVPQSESIADLVLRGSGAEHVEVDAILTTDMFSREDAMSRDGVDERIGDDDDVIGVAVEKPLGRFQRADDRASRAHRPDVDDGGRPEIAHLEHERHALQAGERVPCDGGEELRAGGDHDVGPGRHEGTDRGGAHGVRGVVQAAPQDMLVGRCVDRRASDVDADIGLVSDVGAASVGRGDDSRGVIRESREHGDVVPVRRPRARELGHPVRGGVHLGRVVVGEKENTHVRLRVAARRNVGAT